MDLLLLLAAALFGKIYFVSGKMGAAERLIRILLRISKLGRGL